MAGSVGGFLAAPFAAMAHRGFSPEGFENSAAAFDAAHRLGYHYVETDAHATADGVAVALHDASLDRTTTARGAVGDLPWQRVRAALIGGREPVPALEDLLGAWPDLRWNIDVKDLRAAGPVAAAIERTGAHDRVCIASFAAARRRATLARLTRPVVSSAAPAAVAAVVAATAGRAGAADPSIRPDSPAVRAVRRALREVDCLQIPERYGVVPVITRRFVAAVHAAGRKVHVWTINDAGAMRRLIDAGVDGIVTDRADVLRDVLRERGRWD